MPNRITSLAIASLLLPPAAFAFPSYRDGVPNGRNVFLNGQRAVAIGHENPFSTSASRGSANPFGILADDTGADWAQMCSEDSDGDGRINGVELCDPDCTWREGDNDPACAAGAAITHPGIDDAVGFGGVELPIQQKIHALCMFLAWLFLAPVGIVYAVLNKKSGKPFWFKLHRAALFSAAVFTVMGFVAMVAVEGTAALENGIQHAKFGIIVVLLAIAQPISGYFRPHNPPKGQLKSSKRLWWELQHQVTGRVAMIFAAASIITGIEAAFGNEGAGWAIAIIFVIVTLGLFIYVIMVREGPAADNRRQSKMILENPKAPAKFLPQVDPMEQQRQLMQQQQMLQQQQGMYSQRGPQYSNMQQQQPMYSQRGAQPSYMSQQNAPSYSYSNKNNRNRSDLFGANL